jgi:hypothetical protein
VNRLSPTIEGFRAIFRRPSLGTAEIAWRWSFGTAVAALVGASLVEYLDTLPVNNADLFLLRTRHPLLVSRAVNDILKGSAFRFVMAATVLSVALAAGWILLASLGRCVIVRSLLDYFKNRYEEAGLSGTSERVSASGGMRPIFILNFLRVMVSLAALFACVGAFLLASLVSPDKDPQPFLAFLVATAFLLMVWLVWSTLNWYLSLAAIFAVRDGADSFEALALAVGQFRERAGAFFAVGFWFGLAHSIAFVIATSAVGFPLAFAGVLPFAMVFGGAALVTLLYFAAVDWLYAGRLAAYVAIIEAPPFVPETVAPVPPVLLPESPAMESGVAGQADGRAAAPVAIYPPIPPSDDDILSDIPGLVPPEDPHQL